MPDWAALGASADGVIMPALPSSARCVASHLAPFLLRNSIVGRGTAAPRGVLPVWWPAFPVSGPRMHRKDAQEARMKRVEAKPA